MRLFFVLSALLLSNTASADYLFVKGSTTGDIIFETQQPARHARITTYVRTSGAVGIKGEWRGITSARVLLTAADARKFWGLLRKYQDWATIARAEKLQTVKALGSFHYGSGFQKSSLDVSFHSGAKGKKSFLRLTIVGRDYSELDLMLGSREVGKLDRMMSNVEATHAKLLRQTAASDVLR